MAKLNAEDGSFKQASQLFDPENELLVRIFADEPLFPAERFPNSCLASGKALPASNQ